MSGAQTTAGVLSRAAGHGRPAAPVRLVHLGLGNFFRAHQAWYTDRAPDAGDWGIAAFTGRRAELADALNAQEGLYTLVTRAADGDRFDVLSSLSRTSGFIDDTRAFCSIPARHDLSRRVDASWLATLVAEHQLDQDEATETALDLVTGRPREVFKL